MTTDWVETTWGEISTLEYGKGLRDYKINNKKFPVYGTNGPVGTCDEYLCPKQGVIIGRKGAYRGVHFSPTPFYVIDTAYWLNYSDRVDPKWAYYELLCHDINSLDSGSAIPSTSRDSFYGLPVSLPPVYEQRGIVDTLGTLDEKIELNRKTSETLEGIAKALFKSWFVDFDPVRAKAEGRPTGLPNEMSELFPDSFEESKLGETPSGWRFGDLNNLANLNPESWSAKNHPSELIYVDLSGTKNGTIEETVAYEWSDAPSRARRVLKEGDTIVGTVRPGNRSFSLIQRVGLTGSTGFAVIRPKQLFNASFLYVASTSDESIDRLAHLADGGAYPAVRPDVVMETPINIPSEPVQMLFGELTDSLFRKISVNEQESVVLGKLRDALLPRLISGELRVPDAEKMLEEAGV